MEDSGRESHIWGTSSSMLNNRKKNSLFLLQKYWLQLAGIILFLILVVCVVLFVGVSWSDVYVVLVTCATFIGILVMVRLSVSVVSAFIRHRQTQEDV